ncbi:MAG: hypothetical protein IJZ29_03245 [Clostridia bacterium]|nr:hypothetical protein [Candidatus Gastranaerophilales bacterium]MBQ8749465.1 hypothetical protein [Clostridia bacterium]
MKEFYEKQIAQSEQKQKLMELGLRSQMQNSSATLQLSYINSCIELIKAEKAVQEYNKEQLKQFLSGEAQKREEAKKKLGLA